MPIPLATSFFLLGTAAALVAAPASGADPTAAEPAAGEVSPDPPRGEVVERIVCGSDRAQSYALYLPSAYDPARKWPLLIVMDPRGRARLPLDRILPAADGHGYIVASSFNTLSDGPSEPNQAALAAIVTDTGRRFSIDAKRTYLVGFSGTARVAWIFAFRMGGRVAGVIGFGAGLPHTLLQLEELVPELGTPFVFFGGTGRLDFNYEEVRRLDRSLDGIGLVHRMEYYDGPHAWPPAEVFAHAVDWMELEAMKAGLRPPRQDWIESEYARRLEAAEAAAAEGDAVAAWEMYRQAADDFDTLRDVEAVRGKTAALERSKPVRRSRRQEENLERDYLQWVGTLRSFLRDYAEADPLPQQDEALYQLQIAALQRTAGKDPDSPAGMSARRRLALAFVQTSFYQPRDYLQGGDPRRAEGVLRIAAAIRPGNPSVCLQLARAQAQLGRGGEALENLRCAVESGWIGADGIEADELLAPIRSEPGYRALMDELRGESDQGAS